MQQNDESPFRQFLKSFSRASGQSALAQAIVGTGCHGQKNPAQQRGQSMGPNRIIHAHKGYLTETYFDVERGVFSERSVGPNAFAGFSLSLALQQDEATLAAGQPSQHNKQVRT